MIKITMEDDVSHITYTRSFDSTATWADILADGVLPGLRAMTFNWHDNNKTIRAIEGNYDA